MKTLVLRFSTVLLFSICAARAAQPFEAIAITTDNRPPLTLTSSGSSFFDFLDTVVKTHDQFEQLDGRAYRGSMTFLGVRDAIRLTSDAAGTNVTITLAPINFSRTFSGPNRQAVDDQLEDFFKKNGAQTVADFLKAIAESSPIAVTDGNPTAATAVAASGTFSSQGFTSADELASGAAAGAGSKPKFGGISFGMNAGVFEAGPFEGKTYDFSGTLLNFGGETVRVVVPFVLNYLELDSGSQVGGGGVSIALPIRFRQMSSERQWNWRVTPLAGISVRGSLDLASLSPLWQAGVVNTIDYRATTKVVLSLVNQITMHRSISLDYDDLSFDPDVDQQILKNGVRLTTPFSQRVIADCFVIDTRFLKSAAVDQFWTLGGSFSFRVTQKWNLVLGANFDTGDDFKAYSVGLSSAWKW